MVPIRFRWHKCPRFWTLCVKSMPSSRKTIIAIGAALGLTQAIAQDTPKPAPKKDEETPAKKDPVEKTDKIGKTDKQKKGKGIGEIDLPVPDGAPQKSVNVPVYDAKGRKRMNFAIGVATSLDKE